MFLTPTAIVVSRPFRTPCLPVLLVLYEAMVLVMFGDIADGVIWSWSGRLSRVHSRELLVDQRVERIVGISVELSHRVSPGIFRQTPSTQCCRSQPAALGRIRRRTSRQSFFEPRYTIQPLLSSIRNVACGFIGSLSVICLLAIACRRKADRWFSG